MNTLNSSYDLMHSHILEHTLVATSRMSGFEKPDPLHCYDTLLCSFVRDLILYFQTGANCQAQKKYNGDHR